VNKYRVSRSAYQVANYFWRLILTLLCCNPNDSLFYSARKSEVPSWIGLPVFRLFLVLHFAHQLLAHVKNTMSQKKGHLIFHHNFGKCEPINKIFSP